MAQRSVAVVGGGITGLVAARALVASGLAVTVFEAGARPGGQVRTVEVAGHPVDVGAEALHLAGPHVAELAGALGLDMIRSNVGSAWIWTDRGLRRLPAGVGPAGPTRLGPVLSSRILSPVGVLRAAMEPLVPRGRGDDDVGVGDFLARRFGSQVADRLVDPVLGSLHAGDIHGLSLRAATPQVAAQADRYRSLLLAQRHRRGGGAPSFVSFAGGLVELVDALAATPGVRLRLGSPVEDLATDGVKYQLRVGGDGVETFDGVVLAVPARAAARILRIAATDASHVLDELRAASVVTMVAAYPRAAVETRPAFAGTGLLFPSNSGRMLKAATFLTTKWPHLEDPEVFLVRMSAGRAGNGRVVRLDDEELTHRLHSDLAVTTGLNARPLAVHLQRWPDSIAQLEVGHLDRMATIRAGVGRGLVLAGAPYAGIGLATCIRSGREAAQALVAQLEPAAEAAR